MSTTNAEAAQGTTPGTTPYPPEVTVDIYLDSDDKLAVNVTKAKVRAGGRVRFQIKEGETSLIRFVILMKGDTPFGSGESWVGGSKGGRRVRIDGAANQGGTQDHREYSYAILAVDKQGKPYDLDPEIVVGPKDGGT